MKICIVQTQSLKGDIQFNIKNHLKIIERAVEFNADLIVFPELSITNYEPKLAKDLFLNEGDFLFQSFQKISDSQKVTIGVGIPTKSDEGIQISMLIFRPNTTSLVYSKQLLHSDELPYFVAGKSQIVLNIKAEKIAVGICYETLQQEHFNKAIKDGADIYIASVAKPRCGIEKAYKHYPKMAKKYKIPVLMANSIGSSDTFISDGQSAVWNNKGVLIQQLDNKNQAMLIFDTRTEVVESFYQ